MAVDICLHIYLPVMDLDYSYYDNKVDPYVFHTMTYNTPWQHHQKSLKYLSPVLCQTHTAKPMPSEQIFLSKDAL